MAQQGTDPRAARANKPTEVPARTWKEVLVATCDEGRMEDVRRNWPFLRDRRIDAYGDLVRRFADRA